MLKHLSKFRIGFHFLYLVATLYTVFYFTNRIGIPVMGDNPGAVAAGILPGVVVYTFLIMLESLLECLLITKRRWLGTLVQILNALGAAVIGLFLTLVVIYLFGDRFDSALTAIGLLAVLYLVFESIVFRNLQRSLTRLV